MGSFFEWMLDSSLLVLLILAIRKIFMGRIRYIGIYALWLVVLFRFVVPVNLISTPFSVGGFVSEKVFPQRQEEKTDRKEEVTVSAPKTQQQYGDNKGLAGTELTGGTSGIAMMNKQAEKTKDQASVDSVQQEEAAGSWSMYAGKVWIAVSGILFLWLIMSNVKLNRQMKRSRILYGTREKLAIYLVSGIKTPCLYGFLRPAIYLPKNLVEPEHGVGVEREEIGQMITHEYVHYCHGDHIWAMLRILLVSVYWFHPCLWLAVSCSKKDAELACDETVVQRLGERKRFDYGEMLVRLAGDTSWSDFRYSMMPMSRKGKEMEHRIRAISRRGKYSKWILIPLGIVVLTALGITCSTGNGLVTGEQKVKERVTEEKKAVTGTMLPRVMQTGSGVSNWQSAFYGGFSGKENSQDTCEEAFLRYIRVFTEAVNTGRTDKMNQVLAEGSEVYEQQCALVKNYYKRGIREEIKSCSVVSVKRRSANSAELNSDENIKVFYADASHKLIHQTYRYTCELVNGVWIITGMEGIM